MNDFIVNDNEIEAVEKVLLPEGSHFADDARNVIKYWHSTDVVACPGSGKTTVLLAKLKLLADRMPFDDGSGICALSHTNVAVDEIKTRLNADVKKLLNYPNYIGTIQSFVDRFITLPYIRQYSKAVVQFVSTEAYGQYLYNYIYRSGWDKSPYLTLRNCIYRLYKKSEYKNEGECYQNITMRNDGIYHLKRKIAGFESETGKQYLQAKWDLLVNDGILTYNDTYLYANYALDSFPDNYMDLFSKRFKYFFVDEYQDCNSFQRKALEKVYNIEKCCVIKIGDIDQAIYDDHISNITDWIPHTDCLSIASSCRYSQEIADMIDPLRKNRDAIISIHGKCGNKPVIIVFDRDNPSCVIDEYINQIVKRKLNQFNRKHYAIGFRKESSSGLTVGSYWKEFDTTKRIHNGDKYYSIIDDICYELFEGKLYLAEKTVRKLVQKIFQIMGCKNPQTGALFTNKGIREYIQSGYMDLYSECILKLTQLERVCRETVDVVIRALMIGLFKGIDIFTSLTRNHFMDDMQKIDTTDNEVNVYEEKGVKIKFDTIHAVKGQTHDTTLYLETDYKGASDLKRIIQFYQNGEQDISPVYDYCRKLAYVGMSRPRKLLCIAMQAETYAKSNGVFENGDLCEVVDLTGKGNEEQ